MRIAKALSTLGCCSRREAERLIGEGRVAVNGSTVAHPSLTVTPGVDDITINGSAVGSSPGRVYYAVYKPRGVVSTVRDRHASQTVVSFVPSSLRLYPVGRLDKDSEGLMILSNDGAMANVVTHPRYETEKEYLALLDEIPSDDAMQRLRRGVVLDAQSTAPSSVSLGDQEGRGVWVRLVLREGRKREVRRMLGAVGYEARRLVRTRIGPVQLGDLRPGNYRALTLAEVDGLMQQADRRLVVAIDGPSAAGKTTVGTQLATRLHATFLDTGVLYRALTLLAIERGVDENDAEALAQLAATLDVHVRPPTVADGRLSDVLLGDRDVTSLLRSPDVDAAVSRVSSHAVVRSPLVEAQRRAADSGRAVVVGRDIGTVIFPDADVKIYLDASPAERARRRAIERGNNAQLSEVLTALEQRDQQDKTREVAPLNLARDAIVVRTDGLSIDQVTDRIMQIVEEALVLRRRSTEQRATGAFTQRRREPQAGPRTGSV
ncbi:MAG: cytidylate kinase [Chloroflexi bacterium]|nr:cytidylate kinase [Chloroflexota bacterium]